MAQDPKIALASRLKEGDNPFCPDMKDEVVNWLLNHPVLANLREGKFPATNPLSKILKTDAWLHRLSPGDIVVRAGDYGNSAFIILRGQLREFSAADLSGTDLGRMVTHKRTLMETISQLWQQRRIPEVRHMGKTAASVSNSQNNAAKRGRLADLDRLVSQFKAKTYAEGSLFGEFAALGRMPHPATVAAETECELLEIRWQGLSKIRRFCDNWREEFDARFRATALKNALRSHRLFAKFTDASILNIVGQTLFETYGTYDWHATYKERALSGNADEPVLARQGDYADGMLLIRAGFARLTTTVGHGERTITYLGPNDYFGLSELYDAWKNKTDPVLQNSLTGLGYVDVLRVPTKILEAELFPRMKPPQPLAKYAENRPLKGDALMEWLVDERFINATKAMLIDLDRCVRCDDCVRACASTHGGNPRFIRQGKTYDHWMVTNACMHCTDPLCLIGCPTGAIHRSESGGTVLINDDTCIGCSTCANSCPYDNIVMAAINDERGRPILDAVDQKPLYKATKCDLCSEQITGPACVRACPYDALDRVDFRKLSL